MLTSKRGRGKGAFLHGSRGPQGRAPLIRVATLRREPVPDNALPGTVPAVPIRQRPCPEPQPPTAAPGSSARGAPAALPELRAVLEGLQSQREQGCARPPQDPRLSSGKGCDSPGYGK